VIKKDAPMATMEEALVPLYMYHRYAVESAASALGGQDYVYAFRGDDRIPTKWVSAAQQRAALTALVNTLAPSELALPKNALLKIPPRPSGWGMHRELFTRYTGEVFDPISPASAAAFSTKAASTRSIGAWKICLQQRGFYWMGFTFARIRPTTTVPVGNPPAGCWSRPDESWALIRARQSSSATRRAISRWDVVSARGPFWSGRGTAGR